MYLAASVCEVEPEMLASVVTGGIGVACYTYERTHKCTCNVILRCVLITFATLEDQ